MYWNANGIHWTRQLGVFLVACKTEWETIAARPYLDFDQ
jgi:hypothetical protein